MTLADRTFTHPRVKRWTKEEYVAQTERGFFGRSRLYLFRGELIEIPPQGHPHEYAVMELTAWMASELSRVGWVRIQLPFETHGDSMPEPDAALIAPSEKGRFPHPNKAILIVEVADSSLGYDRDKALEYAASEVPEYWIVDCANRRVEVYREVIDDPTSELGKRYGSLRVFEAADRISPQAKPDVTLVISTLFPET